MAEPEVNDKKTEVATWNTTHFTQAESLIEQVRGHVEALTPTDETGQNCKFNTVRMLACLQVIEMAALKKAVQ